MSTETASTSGTWTRKRLAALEEENDTLRRAIASRQNLDQMFNRYGDDVILKSIHAGLHGVSETNNVWQAVHAVLRNTIRDETSTVSLPDITNEALRANAGRLSMAIDLQERLLMLWSQANKPEKTG